MGKVIVGTIIVVSFVFITWVIGVDIYRTIKWRNEKKD